MKLAWKIVAVCLVAMILITALSIWLIARREFQRVKELQQSDALRVGNLIRESVDLAYQKEGQQGIVQAIKTQTIETGHVRYRWVWFDVSVNDPNHPSASSESLDKILEGEVDSIVATQDGTHQLHTYYPLNVSEQSGNVRKGAIEVSGSLETAEQEAWRTIKTGLAAIAAMVVFCLAFVSWAGVRLIGQPLSLLIEQTRKMGDGEFESNLELPASGEFGELATALSNMGQRISTQQQRIEIESSARAATTTQLRHADRLKTVGRLAAGIAHEIGTPLNVVSGRAGLIRSGKLTPIELAESAEAIQTETNRIVGIVRQLLDFARHNRPQRTTNDMRILVDRTIHLLETLARKNRVSFELKTVADSPFTAFVDPSQIQQVLTNLLVNAIQAMPEGGTIEIELDNCSISKTDGQVEDFVQILIRDHGAGMDEVTRSQIFEPFFTTKEIGQGTGLGLSIAQGIIEEHGGQIEVDSEPGVGTTFRVMLSKKNSSITTPQVEG